MLAVDFDEPGGPEVLRLVKISVPKINEDEVLIKVRSAGVNRPDVIQRQGNYPAPHGHSKILGLEVSGIIEKVNKSEIRGAEFRAVAILSDGSNFWKSTGVCQGSISHEIKGQKGFGYDPIFIPSEGDGRTFGELGAEVKNQISHRKKAMQGLSNLLKSPSR